MASTEGLDDTLALMRDLRARCEWDAAQTPESLRPYLIEEAYELDDAIRAGDDRNYREELGDVLLQVLFHSVIAEERGAFSFRDVADGLIAKMKARHPHIYGDGERQSWEAMKARKRESLSEGLPRALPALHRAQRLQDRAAGVGFDWPDWRGAAAKVAEELDEARDQLERAAIERAAIERPPTTAPPAERHAALQEELGDLLFACVNLCRKADVHAALALDAANLKFERRFAEVERRAREQGIDVTRASLEQLDALWDEVKAAERAAG